MFDEAGREEINTHTYTPPTHAHTHAHTYTHTHPYTRMRTCAHAHAHMHTRTHAHAHTYTPLQEEILAEGAAHEAVLKQKHVGYLGRAQVEAGNERESGRS